MLGNAPAHPLVAPPSFRRRAPNAPVFELTPGVAPESSAAIGRAAPPCLPRRPRRPDRAVPAAANRGSLSASLNAQYKNTILRVIEPTWPLREDTQDRMRSLRQIGSTHRK